ncbi:DUF2784 domain-containing protein [Paludisphaera borealis]|uniref:DUF2784 domain-containing protein n=1 Tax=Paludisphaera borealis TaxID=1387353 RepID=A0A1U7CQ81_9BACT|nr:DUF2784 domain-containing protein [Paludisphaera borealis]APW61069.1 hypothetical protein BSF38_02572 [Paludisphaera borealis]
MNPLIMLADLIVVIHFALMAFIVFGLLVVLLGVVFRWAWVRNIWFRAIHLFVILVIVGEALAGVRCPLTVWEHDLRVRAGQTTFEGDFIAHWVHRLMFFRAEPWVFTVAYITFGLVVLATFLLAPPRFKRDAKPTVAPEPADA